MATREPRYSFKSSNGRRKRKRHRWAETAVSHRRSRSGRSCGAKKCFNTPLCLSMARCKPQPQGSLERSVASVSWTRAAGGK
ncbi:unnamed protein product [Chondrus crispus]|uniref:Uncharacterized protein n=1 Tax=Chondrus crispus TaxID=2769 RepID=R7QJ01_CHOCR|nr:unnamed protein product [Chondrus crispus]CDF37400.1 unnamed protein product [Chondrus crispus]|eukprot:XP_005717219.1 unnamed protein product [Chondrus crispus]